MFHTFHNMQPFSKVSPAILQLIGNPTHNRKKNTWNSFTPVVDIGAGSSRSSLSCTICDDMMCWCFRTCAYNSWNWHYPLSHLFIGLFYISRGDLLKTHFLWLIPSLLVVFSRRKIPVSPRGPCRPKIWKLSMKLADFVIMRQVWTTYLWSISVSAATKTHMSHILSKFQAKQLRLILYPNKKLTSVFDTIPIGWLWSCQSTIEHFTFLWDEVCFFKTWCKHHLKQPSSLGCFCRKRRLFCGKSHWHCQRFGGKLQVVFVCSNCMVLFHQDLPAVIIHIQRCKNGCD